MKPGRLSRVRGNGLERGGRCLLLSVLLIFVAGGPVGGEEDAGLIHAGEGAEGMDPRRSWWSRLAGSEHWDMRYHQTSRGMMYAVDRLDRLFGDENLNEINRTRMALRLGLVHDGRDGLYLLSVLRLRLSLPRLEDRLQLILDDAFEVDEPGDQQAIVDAVRDWQPDTGLRYFLSRQEYMKVSTDLGIRLRDPVQLYLRGRWSLRIPREKWDIRVTEAVYWFTSDGWRSNSDVTMNRLLPFDWQFRTASRLVWEELESGVAPSQTFSMTWQPTVRRAWRFYVSGVWPETPHTQTATYATGIVFRRRLHRDWLYFEVSPAVEFPQAYDYQANAIARIELEVVFSTD